MHARLACRKVIANPWALTALVVEVRVAKPKSCGILSHNSSAESCLYAASLHLPIPLRFMHNFIRPSLKRERTWWHQWEETYIRLVKIRQAEKTWLIPPFPPLASGSPATYPSTIILSTRQLDRDLCCGRQESVWPSGNSESSSKEHRETLAWLQGGHRMKCGGPWERVMGKRRPTGAFGRRNSPPGGEEMGKSICITTVHIWSYSCSGHKKVALPKASLFHAPGKFQSKKYE